MRRVLVVDDEENIRLVLRTLLKKHDYQVEAAESAEAALRAARALRPGLRARRRPHERHDRARALRRAQGALVAGHRDPHERLRLRRPRHRSHQGRRVRLHLEALQAGRGVCSRSPKQRSGSRSAERTARSSRRCARSKTFHGILGKSEAIDKVFATIDKVADYTTTVLIQGESGTGKELVCARAAFGKSSAQRRTRSSPLNCGAIPGDAPRK